MVITYPRACPRCGTKINNRSNFSRHRKYCGTNVKVACLHCNKVFSRKDKLTAHIKKFHSEVTKRKAQETAELLKLEVLHATKVPRLSVEQQSGGAVTTRGMKRSNEEESSPDVKEVKNDEEVDVSDTHEGEPNPLFVADVKKWPPAKCWKDNAVVNQKFIMTLDQQRPAKEGEDLNIGATHAIATDNLIEELKIPEDYWMTLQIGSHEHRREGLTEDTWKIPVADFTNRALYTQSLLHKLSNVLNSGEFITNDVGFSTSVLFSRSERKGGKSTAVKPGEKI